MHDKSPLPPQIVQHRGHHRGQGSIVNADQLMLRMGRIGQWPKDIKDRAHADFSSRSHGVAHGAVQGWREEKTNADVLNSRLHAGGRQVISMPSASRRSALPH